MMVTKRELLELAAHQSAYFRMRRALQQRAEFERYSPDEQFKASPRGMMFQEIRTVLDQYQDMLAAQFSGNIDERQISELDAREAAALRVYRRWLDDPEIRGRDADRDHIKPNIFLSFSFQSPWSAGIYAAADEAAKHIGFNLITGYAEASADPLSHDIATTMTERIRKSDACLAVLTPRDSDNGTWISFELGAAACADIPFLVVAHQEVDGARWKRIMGHKFNIKATGSISFESRYKELIFKAFVQLMIEMIDRKSKFVV